MYHQNHKSKDIKHLGALRDLLTLIQKSPSLELEINETDPPHARDSHLKENSTTMFSMNIPYWEIDETFNLFKTGFNFADNEAIV